MKQCASSLCTPTFSLKKESSSEMNAMGKP